MKIGVLMLVLFGWFVLNTRVLGEEASVRNSVLVEAESFLNLGGWLVDPQFMDQMGSPYLLAHGLGQPVQDATTMVEFPREGTYHVFVRTKDWVAQWHAPGTPGRFQVLVDGKALATTFGITNAQWDWQPGGTVNISRTGQIPIALHDLTGFEGRCDAILFTKVETFSPPNKQPEMRELRCKLLGIPKEPSKAGSYDLVVVGGGIAGSCAAVTAARLGLKVALVQDRPVLGGNNSSEVRVWLQGARTKEPWPRVGDVLAEFEQDRRAHYGPSNTAELYEDQKKRAVVEREPNIHLFMEYRANEVVMNTKTVAAVIAQEVRTGRRFRVEGRYFSDCTGDGVIGELAGADYDIQPQGRLGQCNLWNVCECKDTNALNVAVGESTEDAPFPRCPWALDLSQQPFPGRSKTKPDIMKLGG
ncbi:MAG TPA: FAD-dependent oxidoreductase [Candidatus Dormibacteraeota bacterium]|nr:FAD-dependent oxidoreductase [Candidatus Dormibacteraeota bacterium]